MVRHASDMATWCEKRLDKEMLQPVQKTADTVVAGCIRCWSAILASYSTDISADGSDGSIVPKYVASTGSFEKLFGHLAKIIKNLDKFTRFDVPKRALGCLAMHGRLFRTWICRDKETITELYEHLKTVSTSPPKETRRTALASSTT